MSDIVVIGAQAAGLSAALQARRVNAGCSITVLEKSAFIATGTCGLPFFLLEEAAAPDRMLLHSARELEQRYRIRILLEHEVREINPSRKSVRCVRPGGEIVDVPFQRLVVATGARPHRPAEICPDCDTRVFFLRNLADGIRLKQFIRQERPSCALVLGAGRLGLEMAEIFHRLGLRVEVAERECHILPEFPPALADVLEERLTRLGMRFWKGRTPTKIQSPGRGIAARFATGRQIDADFMFCATGVVPNTEMLLDLPVRFHDGGFLRVDPRQETTIGGIFAAGDCATLTHRLTGDSRAWPSGVYAAQTGQVAGENAAGRHREFPGILNSFCLRVFQWEIASAGLSEHLPGNRGFALAGLTMEATVRPPYFDGPPAALIHGVFFTESRRLAGVHVLGETGAAAIVHPATLMIQQGFTVEDMLAAEFPYTPPLGALWHPLQQLARLARKNLF